MNEHPVQQRTAKEVESMDKTLLDDLLYSAKFGAESAAKITQTRQAYGLNRQNDDDPTEALRPAWCPESSAGDPRFIDYVAGVVDPKDVPRKRVPRDAPKVGIVPE